MSSQCYPARLRGASKVPPSFVAPSSLLSPGDTAPLWLAHSGATIPPWSQAVSAHSPRGVHSPATVSGWPPDSANSGQQSPAPRCSGRASPAASYRQGPRARAAPAVVVRAGDGVAAGVVVRQGGPGAQPGVLGERGGVPGQQPADGGTGR